MCNVAGIVFGAKSLAPEEVRGASIIEVGSYDVNGSLRPILQAWGPSSYVGVDLIAGPGVDVVCPAEELVARFGAGSFDLVVSTEMVEHVRDWRAVFTNMLALCREGGLVVVTTRSPGYPYHAWPHDFWRYDEADMRAIFAGWDAVTVERDPSRPGVFVKARKPVGVAAPELGAIALTSVLTGQRQLDVAPSDFRHPLYAWGVARDRLKTWVERLARG